MKLKAIRLSKAKTAYGLVSDVIRAIEKEPELVDMGTYRSPRHPNEGGPACGTVGCFAGWVCMMRGSVTVGTIVAQEILGRNMIYNTVKSSSGFQKHVFDGGFDIPGYYGTKRYARGVIRRIKRFQKINARALRARKLEPCN